MNGRCAALALLILIGLAGFTVGFSRAPLDAWVWLLFNFVFFTGIMNGVLVWSAVFAVTHTSWTSVIGRLGHSAIAFVPVSMITLLVLLDGAKKWLPWVSHPVPAKAAWLNLPFMAVRDVVSLVALWVMFFLLIRWSRAGERGTNSERFRVSAIATAAVMIYTITGTMIAYDFIMSLTPEWYSSMFAPYFWVTNAYAGLAVLVLLSAAVRGLPGAGKWLKPQQFKDLGNLMLGLALFSMGLFFAQYITVWYENLPEEVGFIILRYDKGAWPPLGWLSFALAYGLPFILLQSRAVKLSARGLSVVAAIVLVGVALERYVLIVPSIEPGRLMLSPVTGLVSLAFAGAFISAIWIFLRRYSPVSLPEEESSRVN